MRQELLGKPPLHSGGTFFTLSCSSGRSLSWLLISSSHFFFPDHHSNIVDLCSSHLCISPDSFIELLYFSNISSCSLSLAGPRLVHHQKIYSLSHWDMCHVWKNGQLGRTHMVLWGSTGSHVSAGSVKSSSVLDRKNSNRQGHTLFA